MSNSVSTKMLFSFLWQFVKLQKRRFFFITILSFIWSIDATLWPYLLKRIIDVFTAYDADRGAAWGALKEIVPYGILLWVAVEAGFRGRGLISAKAFSKLEADVRIAMFDHVQHHSPKYFNDHFAGSLTNKINDFTTQATSILQKLMTLFLPTLLTSLISIVIFSQLNLFFALILGGWMLTHFSICFAFTPKCAEYSNIHGESRSTLVGKIVDSLTNNFAVNLFYRFPFEKARIAAYQVDEQQKNYRSQRYVQMMFIFLSITHVIGGISVSGLMITYWLKGRISTGEIVQIFNTTWNMLFMMWIAGEMIPQFFQSVGIAKQALTIMQDPQDVLDPPGAKSLVVGKGEIIFDSVSFHYKEKRLFENKHVHIKGGEKIGLVGYSGSGKSTFVNLILRFYPLEKGRIMIDGQDIAQVTLESLRKQVTMIPQEPMLFHRSVEENIVFGRVGASREEVLEVTKLAHCDEFIRKTAAGYERQVGERGSKLSGGERQRIAIARAMLARTPILILDEATSALDSVTENYIQESLERLMMNRTTIVIAHRLSTLAKMDRILVFDQGKIVEEGSHETLLAKEGHYAHMWNMQAGGFLPEKLEVKSSS